MHQFLFALCLVAFVIGYALQIREYRRKPAKDKNTALIGLTLTGLSGVLIVVANLMG